MSQLTIFLNKSDSILFGWKVYTHIWQWIGAERVKRHNSISNGNQGLSQGKYCGRPFLQADHDRQLKVLLK